LKHVQAIENNFGMQFEDVFLDDEKCSGDEKAKMLYSGEWQYDAFYAFRHDVNGELRHE